MKFARLVVTDGSAVVDLLNIHSSFATNAWRQSVAQLKGGGTWQQSALSDGQRLVTAHYDLVTDAFPVILTGQRQDIAIRAMQDLLRLLVKADYYDASDWQDEPVWIEARTVYETNTRYAIIHHGTVPDLGELLGTAFTDSATLPDLTLEARHGHWTSYAPGTATAVAISASETYDGRNLGNVDSTGTEIATTSEEVFVANKRNVANLTDIYVDNGGVWGGNLLDAALPYDLLPAVPVANDAVYFGIDTSLANSGPFCSLVFDLSTAQVGCTIAWEYWSGAAWVTLQARDNTNANGDLTGDPFDTAGVRSVHWWQPANWATRDISLDGGPVITGYWVRARVTAVAGPSPPTQQNRDVYSIVWPYVNIGLDQVRGDIESLARTIIRNRSKAPDSAGFAQSLYGSRVVMGLRSYSRGANFTAYINFSDEQNPTGITITPAGGVVVFGSNIQSVTGRTITWTPAGANPEAVLIEASLGNAINTNFLGEFHAFVRAQRTGGTAASVPILLETWLGANYRIYRSDEQLVVGTNEQEVIDFGVVSISPKALTQNDVFDDVKIVIKGTPTAAGAAIEFFDLILIPTDEWAAVVQRSGSPDLFLTGGDLFSRGETYTKLIDAGSILKPKEYITALLLRGDTSRAISVYQTIPNGQFILQANRRQRLWFFVIKDETISTSPLNADFEVAHSIREYKNERYLGPRGSR